MKRNPKLTALTPEEDARWEQLFVDYVTFGFSDSAADKLTWSCMQREFPRLAVFDGCTAEAA